MCGRFALYSNPTELAKIFGISQSYSIETSYNIAPTENVTVICQLDLEQRIAVTMRWGLIPPWQNAIKKLAPLINARLETIETKPAFHSAIKFRRCLIIADGFFEWSHSVSGKKQSYFIQLKNKSPFAMAGIWERWVSGDQSIDSCCIITTSANELVHPLHDRTPAIIHSENYSSWLDSKNNNIDQIKKLVSTLAANETDVHPVSTVVNKATYKGDDCVLWINDINNKQ